MPDVSPKKKKDRGKGGMGHGNPGPGGSPTTGVFAQKRWFVGATRAKGSGEGTGENFGRWGTIRKEKKKKRNIKKKEKRGGFQI